MKKIFIGRGADNQVRIKDDSDKVSRRQAVIEVSFLGKMRIHDTSTNGTFVNGKPVEKPNGTPVKRGDKVDLAHVTNLDWSLVRDPYKGLKIAIGVFLIVLIGLAAIYFIYADTLFDSGKNKGAEEELVEDTLSQDDEAEDTMTIAAPAADKQKSNKKKAAPAAPKNDKQNPGKKLPSVNDKNKNPGNPGDPNKDNVNNDDPAVQKPGADKNGLLPKRATPSSKGNWKKDKY